MKEAILEVIGAVVVTTVILGIPVLSFMLFVHGWDGFLQFVVSIGLIVDFLYVLNMLIGEEE